MKRGEKGYTKADLTVCRMLVVGLVFIYSLNYLVIGVNSTNDLAEKIGFSHAVEVWSLALFFGMPILIILLLYMCIERYMYLEFYGKADSERMKDKKLTYLSIALILILGKIMIKKQLDVIVFVMLYWNLIKNLHVCILLDAFIALLWFLAWVYIVERRDAISVKGGVTKKEWMICLIVMVLVMGATKLSNQYIGEETSRQWYSVLDDYSQNCDPTVDEHPSKN